MPDYQRLILLVDDEDAVRGIMRDALVRAGFTVAEAGDYNEAIRASDGVLESLQLLVADVSLPGRNGCELANELKRQRADLPCLFISGYTGAEVCRAYGVGLSDVEFLAKPFDPRELVERVQLLLDGPTPDTNPRLIPKGGHRYPKRPLQ
jgi:DNA-binding response OmpR family regulator